VASFSFDDALFMGKLVTVMKAEEHRKIAAEALAQHVGSQPWTYMNFIDWKNCAEALLRIDYVRCKGDWRDINEFKPEQWQSLKSATREFIDGVERNLSETVDPEEWAWYGTKQPGEYSQASR